MNAFAEQYADTLHKTCLMSVAICDRDCVIACAGVPRKDFFEKRLSADIDDIIEKRGFYQYKPGSRKISVTDGTQAFYTVCAMPIISGGDVIGCVASLAQSAEERECGEAEAKLTKTAAGFLSRQFGD